MINFSDTCLDIESPNFTEECSKGCLDLVGIEQEKIKNCMTNNIDSRIK